LEKNNFLISEILIIFICSVPELWLENPKWCVLGVGFFGPLGNWQLESELSSICV